MSGTVVYLLFYVYLSNSLKHHERKLRGEPPSPSLVSAGPDQSPEVSMKDLLGNTSFKKACSKNFLCRNGPKRSILHYCMAKQSLFRMEDNALNYVRLKVDIMSCVLKVIKQLRRKPTL